MKQRQTWLLALLSILIFVMAPSLVTAASSSGKLEVGATYSDIVDSSARVNEYVKNSAVDNEDDGLAASLKLDLQATDGVSAFDINADIVDGDTYHIETGFDAARIFKLNLSLDSLQHWKDHETLNQMGATARDDIDRSQPSVTTDKIMADLQDAGFDINTFVPANDPDGGVGGGTFPVDYNPRERYEQELANDYIVTRRETEAKTDFTLPALPNIIFHAGIRIETRNGMEQAISLQKCDSCHVSAVGKNIDERTEDFTFGLTGKFGLVTLDYEYKNRSFSEDSSAPIFYYEDATNPTAFNLLYEDGDYEFARTPDSDKDSHSLKARVDFTANTNLVASYVKSDVESSKSETQGEYTLEHGDTLKTEYESYGAKLATRIGNLRLSLRGSQYEIAADNNEIYFANRVGVTAAPGYDPLDDSYTRDEWVSAEEREVSELGLDAVYRLAAGTTLRLGYGYEQIERVEEELGETKTHTLKAALKARINKSLSGRLSYEYQDIDEPMAGAHVGIAQGIGTADPLGSGLWYLTTSDVTPTDATKTWYWSKVYPNRTMESTNQPESVHETKLNTTWSISPNMAATIFARARFEENDSVGFEQETYVPGISFWYAPNSKMNLTMAYTFNKQKTENNMCVGWYHG